jgi:hypothetical protein
MADHAKLSPSAAHRWLTCPASAEAAERSVRPDTEASSLGTAAHWVRSEWMSKGAPPPVGTKAPNGLEVTQKMIDLVSVGIGWSEGYVATAEGRCVVLVEEQVQIARFFGLEKEVCFGTADQLILAPKELVVFDLKAGYVDVAVEDNEQLTLYAIGACEELGWIFDTIRYVIDQPQNGGIKEWVISKENLLKKAEEMRPKVLEAASPNARFNPTEEACRYCPIAGVCTALQSHAIELAKQEFSVEQVANISVEDLALILRKADLVETAIKAAREHALKLIQLGQEVPGYKAVEGRKNRAWREGVERTVMENAEVLGFDLDTLAPRKLCSPAQAEKAGLKNLVEQFAEKPKGNPVLAPDTDKRPALPAHFQVLDAGDLLE